MKEQLLPDLSGIQGNYASKWPSYNRGVILFPFQQVKGPLAILHYQGENKMLAWLGNIGKWHFVTELVDNCVTSKSQIWCAACVIFTVDMPSCIPLMS